MIQPSVALFTTAIVAFAITAAPAADLSFATPNGLFRLEPDSGDREALLPEGDRPFNALVWSRNGEQLAIAQNYGEVYRIEAGESSPQLVFSSDCQRPPTVDLAWQLDGETLVIMQRCPAPTAGAPAELALFLSRPTGELASFAALPDSLESDIYLAPDGTQIAYVTGQHIFVAGLDGSRPRRITQTPGIYGAAGSPLAWSPDGTQLAFYEGSYPFQRLNVVSISGGDRRVLTPEANFQIYRSRVLWSPNGRYIAYYRPHNPPLSNQEIIALVNVNTGETQALTRPGFYDALSWSPNSQQLALASGAPAGRQTLFRLDLASQDFTALTNQPLQNILDSQWSPDGDWIAFTATPPDDPLGTQVLHRVHPDGTALSSLTASDEYVYPFAWVPISPAANTQGLDETP